MYAREINGQTLTFGVSGKLWANGLMMYDHQTGSLWSHAIGQAVTGPMQGAMLRMLTATQTDWGTWKRLQPATFILDPSKSPYERDYNIDPYEGYYASRDTGVMAVRREDVRLDAKTLVVGVRLGEAVKVYPFSRLGKERVVNDTVAEVPLLVVFQEKGTTGIVFSRRVGEQALTFVPLDKASDGLMTMRDEQTGSRWSAFKGIALEGPLQGAQLERLPSTYAFWFAWKDHYPETAVYGDDDAVDSKGGSP